MEPIDLDNLPKPIIDGLKGIVIADDNQVEEIVPRRLRPTSGSVVNASPSLAAALVAEAEFVHILAETQ